MHGNTTIPRLSSRLSLSQQTASLDVYHPEQLIHVTRDGNGEIRAVPSNDCVAAEVVGDNVYLRPVSTGAATVTVYVGPGSVHNAPAFKTINVTAEMPSTTLAECSWADIQAAAHAGLAQKLWPLGGLTKLNLLDGQIAGTDFADYVTFRIVDFEPCNLVFMLAQNADGVEIALTTPDYSYNNGRLVTPEAEGFCMNRVGQVGLEEPDPTLSSAAKTDGPNKFGWLRCYGRVVIMPQIYDALPADLQAVIALSTIWTDNVGDGNTLASSIFPTQDRVFLASEANIFATLTRANPNTAAYERQWAWFTAGNNPKAKAFFDPTMAAWQFLRDSKSDSDDDFCGVGGTTGNIYTHKAAFNFSMRPCFRV